MRIIIGLTGTMNSGKGVVGEYLATRGFEHFILSEIIKDETSQKNLPLTRENLQDVGDILRKSRGPEVLAKLAFERAKTDHILIDGIRNPGEINYIRSILTPDDKFLLLAVDAPLSLRFKRAKERKSPKDIIDYATFVRDDARDRGIGQPLNGQQVQACIDQANIVLINDVPVERIKQRIDKVLEELHT